MKRNILFFVCCLVSLIAAVTAFAQQGNGSQFGYGFTGSQGSSGQYGYGFTGPSQIVPVTQAQSYSHGSPVIIKGIIVQAIGGDLYLFRDSSGEIVIRIGPKEWQYYGSTISPSDTIEISGEVHRRNWQQPEVHARFIRKV
jgi:uncharacterized protein (TIGR00156 family)